MMLKRNLFQMFSTNYVGAWVIIAGVISVVTLSLAAHPVAALLTTPDWVSSEPVMVGQEPIVDGDEYFRGTPTSCQFQTISYVADANLQIPEQRKMCVVEGDGFRLAFSNSVFDANYLGVSFGLSQKFYKLTYPGQSSGYQLVILPHSQRYVWVTHSYLGTNMHLFDNLPTSLKRDSRGWYEVDLSLATQIWQTSRGVQGWGISDNGKYAVYGVGPSYSAYSFPYVLVLENIETGEVSRIGTYHYVFEAYPMGPPQLKVSDDGSMIVASGGGGIKSWKVDQGCLQLPDRMFTYDDKCPSRTYFPPIEPWNYQYADNRSLWVSDDWSELSYHHNANGQSAWEKVTIRASNVEPGLGLDYLALGDSYSSGEGDLVSGYIEGTGEKSGCHVSASSYPYLLKQQWGVLDGKMASVACSGAKIWPDYIARMEGYLGQNSQLENYPETEHSSVRQLALQDLKSGIVPQLEFVKKYKPSVVTLTGGGNDVGFADVIKYCASPYVFQSNTCSYANNEKALSILRSSIYNQYANMTNLISQMRSASPLTKIYVIGYPQFVAQPGALGCGLNAAALNSSEIEMIRNMVVEMNDVLWLAAKDAGVQFVDVEDSLEGGQICGGGKYMTGVWSVGIVDIIAGRTSELFHPNSFGHGRIANTIKQSIGNFGGDVASSPARETKLAGEYFSSQTSVQKEVASGLIYEGTMVTIRVPATSFGPGTTVVTTLFSDPVELGRTVSGDDGSVVAEFTIPEAVEPGEHLLLLEGQTYAGEPIAIYQYVTVGVKEGDVDGDGVPDEEDRCQFITEWFDEETGQDVCKEPEPNDPGETDGPDNPGQPGDTEPDSPPSTIIGFLQKVTAIIKGIVAAIKTVLTSFFTMTRVGWR